MTPELSAKLERIKAECRKAIELGQKATPKPWTPDEDEETYFVETPERNIVESGSKSDVEFIAHSRAFSPRAAKALLDDIEVLLIIELRGDTESILVARRRLQSIADQWEETL